MSVPLLELDAVGKTYTRGGLFARERIVAARDVRFALADGAREVFTIIGESGSGKTTIAKMILALEQPSTGQVRFRGRDLATLRGRADRHAFIGAVQPIFQNPFEAFNPLKRLERYLLTTCRRFTDARDESEATRAVDTALRQVGLSLAEIRGRHPHELSGGQLQRVAIARALISKPALIVADEPVSMVDASLRASIVGLFRRLTAELGLSIVYITHDLATAYAISDRILIMRKGEMAEAGDAKTVLADPKHPYSRQLRDAVLQPLEPGQRPAFGR
jgi:ABC-type glutathione transport system ATPase component